MSGLLPPEPGQGRAIDAPHKLVGGGRQTTGGNPAVGYAGQLELDFYDVHNGPLSHGGHVGRSRRIHHANLSVRVVISNSAISLSIHS